MLIRRSDVPSTTNLGADSIDPLLLTALGILDVIEPLLLTALAILRSMGVLHKGNQISAAFAAVVAIILSIIGSSFIYALALGRTLNADALVASMVWMQPYEASTPRHLDTPCQLQANSTPSTPLDTPRHPSTPSRLVPRSSVSRCQTRHLDTARHRSTPLDTARHHLDTTSTPLMI